MTGAQTPRQGGQHASLRLDLVIVIGVSAVAAAVCGLAPSSLSPLRVFFALLLTFVLPGYALVEAAYPPRVLSAVHRLVGVVALSLMSSVLGGLALNLTGPGLTRAVWTTFLAGLAMAGSVVALVRWRHSSRGESPKPAFKLGTGAVLLFGTCLIVASGVYVSIRSAQAEERRQPPFTELSMLQEPRVPAPQKRVRLIVGSHEKVVQRYRLTVYAGQDLIATYDFAVQPGRQWMASISVPVSASGRPLAAYLQRGQSLGVYRYVKLARVT